jgi:hypothetical protein
VSFFDYSDLPSGGILIEAIANEVTHPVDILEDILADLDLSDYIDDDSFIAAKAANPNDEVGAYFDNSPAIDAVQEICQKGMYDLFIDGGLIRLYAYTGASPLSPDLIVDKSNIHEAEVAIDSQQIINKVTCKYGWWEKNSLLFYTTEDVEMIEKIGESLVELNYSWAETVTSDNETMIQEKADLLLKRFSRPMKIIRILGSLFMLRLELGDVVRVDHDDLFAEPENFEVFSKTINFAIPPAVPTVEILAVQFMGEYV